MEPVDCRCNPAHQYFPSCLSLLEINNNTHPSPHRSVGWKSKHSGWGFTRSNQGVYRAASLSVTFTGERTFKITQVVGRIEFHVVVELDGWQMDKDCSQLLEDAHIPRPTVSFLSLQASNQRLSSSHISNLSELPLSVLPHISDSSRGNPFAF